jgi:hypothetical protein
VFKYKLCLLVAYPYMTPDMIKLLKAKEDQLQFVLDSGAFTAWKAGSPILLDDYCRFIETMPIKPWRYFALDVIGDPGATMKNYELMLARGFKPIPIFTRGENPSVLDDLYKTSDVVGVGGLVGTPQNKGFVKGVMRVIGSRRVHWLGFTKLSFLKAYRPYMADSSTWETGARFASIPLYLGEGSKIVSLRKNLIHRQIKDLYIQAAIRRCGIDPESLLDNENWTGGLSSSRTLCGRSCRLLSEDVKTHLGTNLFLAATTTMAVNLLLG